MSIEERPKTRRGRGRDVMCSTVRLCPSQVACDGVNLLNGREICGACERALARRQKRETALRGERHMTYTLTRRKP